MALAQGGIVGGLSGRLGDVVYAHSRDGLVVRQFTQPTDPGTARQILMRDALQSANNEWAAVSLSDRSVWMNYGNTVKVANRFGRPRLITGREHFIAWFLAFTGATDAEPVSFPTPTRLHSPAPPLLTFLSVSARFDNKVGIFLQTRFTDPTDDAGALVKIVAYLSPPLALTRNFWKQAFPDHGAINRVAGAPGAVNLQFNSSATWDPAGDQKAFLKFRYIRDDGRLSAFVYSNRISSPA